MMHDHLVTQVDMDIHMHVRMYMHMQLHTDTQAHMPANQPRPDIEQVQCEM